VFLELFQRSIVNVAILVLHNAIALDQTVDPFGADGLFLETENTTAVELFVIEPASV
jgi:hypothetical protein